MKSARMLCIANPSALELDQVMARLCSSYAVLVAAALLGLAARVDSVAAASPYRQCNTSNPPLVRGEAGVVLGDPVFVRHRKNYDISIFGLGAADPDVIEQPYSICLRYEIENASGAIIQELRWTDAGLSHIQSIAPGERIRIPRRKSSNTTDVGTSSTELHAFENIPASGQTVFALQQTIDREPRASPASKRMFGFTLIDQYPALATELIAAGASTEMVPAILLPQDRAEYPPVSIGLETSQVSVSIESSAVLFPADRFGQITGKITVDSRMTGPIAVFAPGLSALESADLMSDEPLRDRVAAFLKSLPDGVAPLKLSNSRYGSTIKFRTQAEGNVPALFIARHPVTIAIGDWSVCLIAETYSPVPIALTETRCRAP